MECACSGAENVPDVMCVLGTAPQLASSFCGSSSRSSREKSKSWVDIGGSESTIEDDAIAENLADSSCFGVGSEASSREI